MSIFIFVFQWYISFRVIQTSYFVEIFFDVLKLNIEKSHCWKEENEIAFLCWSSAKTRVESIRQEIRAEDFDVSNEMVNFYHMEYLTARMYKRHTQQCT